ncbi:MAG: ABC transporter substrate-binding protein [Oscillospiraceae bacterium]|nr:ABC transporter substrate-binding protein [Oscillospiraceae bacterium]
MTGKRFFCALLLFSVLLSLAACAASPAPEEPDGVALRDVNGSTVRLRPESRLVFGEASLAECWLLAGGMPVGVPLDAIEERALPLAADTAAVGTVKSPDLEKIAALEPDYVVLSADLSAHAQLKDSLEQMGIPCGYFRLDSFEDYRELMAQFCAVTGRADLYEENVLSVEMRIAALRDKLPEAPGLSALLLRAYSTGMKAKTDDNPAGKILKDFGLENPAESNPSLLEELSIEKIILDDPDYIFVMTMGSETEAREYLRANVESDPAWSGLSAVKNGRYIILPQELFHYKPNDRWDDSYEYLAKIIYPDLFD